MVTTATPRSGPGFTLLEVMVAIAILGLGLTTILSAQAGAFKSSTHARNLSQAVGLARCKMSETEEYLLKQGFQLTDEEGAGPCCDGDISVMHCAWRIEKPLLPDGQSASLDLGSALGSGPGASGGPSGGGLGALSLLSQAGNGAPVLPADAKVGDIATLLSNANSGLPIPGAMAAPYPSPGGDPNAPYPGAYGTDGGSLYDAGPAGLITGTDPMAGTVEPPSGIDAIFAMILTMVYPSLKPLFEASARRVTVMVTWTEGVKPYSLDVVQWIAVPQVQPLDPSAVDSDAGSPAPVSTGSGKGSGNVKAGR